MRGFTYLPTSAQRAIENIPQQPQAQYSLDEQLAHLRRAAVALGLYDADDYLKRVLGRS